MAKLKKENVPFTQVANDALNDKNLSLKAKGLYAYLWSKPESWDFSGKRICMDHKDGQDAVYGGLSELEAMGYLGRKKLGNGRVTYHLVFTKEQNPVRENPEKEPVRQFPEKQTISNKDIYILPDWINAKAWAAWLEYNKEKRHNKKMTMLTIKLQVKKLEKFGIKDHVEVIRQSIENGWTGLFPLKGETKFDDKASRRSDYARAHEKRLAEEEEKREREANAKENDARNVIAGMESLSEKFKVKS